MWAVNLGQLVQAILFALFAGLTAIVTAIVGPTYDNLLVPELAPSSLYPTLGPAAPGYFGVASQFSAYLLATVVDPAITLAAIGVAVLYLSKVLVARWAATFEGLLPRLVLAVVAANFTLPITGAILGLAGGVYPVISGWDGGAWRSWVNLAGWGQLHFSWDNGALAFVLSLVEFALVFGLVLAVGLRNALLAVLVVVLPIFTLIWPFRPLSTIARRAWFLFVELAFLPCVLVVPLELAVGSPSAVLLVGFLGCALASPYLLSIAGTHLTAFGLPAVGGVVGGASQRGLGVTPAAASSYALPAVNANRTSGTVTSVASGISKSAASAGAPVAAPLAAAQLVGHAALHLVRHLPGSGARGPGRGSWPPVSEGGKE